MRVRAYLRLAVVLAWALVMAAGAAPALASPVDNPPPAPPPQAEYRAQADRPMPLIQPSSSAAGQSGDILVNSSTGAAEVAITLQAANVTLDMPLPSCPAVSEEQPAASPRGWTTVMTEAFEGAFPGTSKWYVDNDSGSTEAYWGKDSYNPHQGQYSIFCAKSGAAGVNPPANYPPNMKAWMIYGVFGPVNLSDATDARVSFWFDYRVPPYGQYIDSSDYLFIGATDSLELPFSGGYPTSNNSGGWKYTYLPLTSFCGKSAVYIAFVFFSNSDGMADKGAFLDDIAVEKLVGCGNMAVSPTTWSPTVTCGQTSSQIVTVSATVSTVNGVTVAKSSGPSWLTVSPASLGDILAGASKQFTITASPPAGTASGPYTYSVTVSNTCGTPTSATVSGTVQVNCCGNMAVSPTTWSPTVTCGQTSTQIVTVSATVSTVNGVTVVKTSGPSWLTVSPTSLGDISAGSSKQFTITASPPAGTASGPYTYTITVSNTCGTPASATVSGSVSVQCGGANWTFMVYLDGDNDLEQIYVQEFNYMEMAANNPNVNIVVQLDRIPGGDSSNGDWTGTRRYKVKHDTHPSNFAAYTLNVDYWDIGEVNMADPAKLAEFVQWAKTNYPAGRYCLALCNHGGGWEPLSAGSSPTGLVQTGILKDDTSGDLMSTAGLGYALNTATSGGNQKLDVLFLDACLMQMIEVEYEIAGYSHYTVASEYYGWAPGPYEDYLSYIGATTTGQQLAQAIVDTYASNLAASGYAHTMSAVSSAQLPLASAVDSFAQALIDGLSTYRVQIENARDGSQSFPDVYGGNAYVDLYHFASLVHGSVADPTIQNAAQAVMNGVNAAVMAEAHGSGAPGPEPYYYNMDNAHGVSIYFPPTCLDPGLPDYVPASLRFVADKGWDEFLHALLCPQVTRVWIDPPQQTVTAGQTFTVDVMIDPVVPVAGAQFSLDFDPGLLSAIAVIQGDLLPPPPSSIFSPGTIDNVAGSVRYVWGAILVPGGSVSTPGTFATVTLQVRTPCVVGTSPLHLHQVIVGDAAGSPVNITMSDGSVTVSCRPWDVNGDGCTDVLDIIRIGQRFGECCYTPPPQCCGPEDVTCDGCIDVLDIIVVGQHIGEGCQY